MWLASRELKRQLIGIDSLRFIFTSPTFVTEKSLKEKREFYIPRLQRERSLYGTEFEIRLRNELTQKAIAHECADWIRKKATFKSNSTQGSMGGFLNIQTDDQQLTYMPLRYDDIGKERNHLKNSQKCLDNVGHLSCCQLLAHRNTYTIAVS